MINQRIIEAIDIILTPESHILNLKRVFTVVIASGIVNIK
jgi:hypothetical protein